MQDVRVNFETAKIAKERGFNIECDWKVDSDGVEEFLYHESYPNNSEYTYNPDEDPEAIAYEERYKKLVNQPTQSSLQKWLREEHGIHINTTFDGFTFDVSILWQNNLNGWESKELTSSLTDITPYMFTEYEQALEEGLKGGLKLIEIVENGESRL